MVSNLNPEKKFYVGVSNDPKYPSIICGPLEIQNPIRLQRNHVLWSKEEGSETWVLEYESPPQPPKPRYLYPLPTPFLETFQPITAIFLTEKDLFSFQAPVL